MTKILHKLFNTSAKSVNDEAKSVDFVISTNQVDRYGDVVDQKSWNLSSYEDNPIVLWGHNPDEPENVLGTASNIKTAPDGSQTTATLTFATDVNPKAATVFELIKRGVLRTVSVGFRNHSLEYDEDTPVLKDNELLEISVVPIPANAGAVALSLKDGSLHEKDSRWLLDSMRKESKLIEKELANLTPKEKSMTPEQEKLLQAAVDGLTKTNEKLDALAEENKTLREQLEAKEAAEADAAEAAKKAEEEAAARKAEEDKDDPAKGGKEDQPGAGEDEIDEDAELTPEEEAEAREALGLPAAA